MKNSCLFIISLFLLSSCTFSFKRTVEGEGKAVSVSVEEFAGSISEPSIQLVDVRTPEEFLAGNIPGSVNIDVMTGHFAKDALEKLDKARTVAVYCRSGNRSKTASKMLAMMGYNVVELDKGYNAWVESGR